MPHRDDDDKKDAKKDVGTRGTPTTMDALGRIVLVAGGVAVARRARRKGTNMRVVKTDLSVMRWGGR